MRESTNKIVYYLRSVCNSEYIDRIVTAQELNGWYCYDMHLLNISKSQKSIPYKMFIMIIVIQWLNSDIQK